MYRRIIFSLFVFTALFVTSFAETVSPSSPKNDSTKLLRFPDIHGKTIVFCYGGDLWKVASKGGTATRLTAHEGLEVFPKFSPDGKWIAFTGQYDGDEQVYVIPASGGVPRQLTFYPSVGPMPPRRGYDNIVYGWTPDGKNIVFRSLRDSNSVTELGTLYTVPIRGGLPRKTGMPTAGAGDFSPDGKKIVYSPLFRDFRSWKRYEGGWTQYLVIFDLETKESKRLDQHPRTEREPIWIDNKIYFTSDRTGTMNLFEYNTQTENIVQCTDERQWDVRWASGDKEGQIVYELGGELVVYNTKAPQDTERFSKINVRVPHDGLAMRPARINVSGNIEQYAAAPGGKRVAMTARGDLFTVPVDKGYVRNYTCSSNAHERCPVWSYNGKTIVYISDKTGEDQLYLQEVQGTKTPLQLTNTFKGQLDYLRISPCGRYLSVSDCNAKLWIVAVQGNEHFKQGIPVEVVTALHGGIPVGNWSPCGGYLAYILYDPQGFGQLHIYELATKKSRLITDPVFDVREPVWEPAGNYLYFLSQREFAPQHSSVEWNFAGNRNTGIFALALRKNVANLFAPQFDEETTPITPTPLNTTSGTSSKPPEETTTDAGASNDTTKLVPKPSIPKLTKIDWDGLSDRVIRIPVTADNFDNFSASGQFLYYLKRDASFYGRDAERKPRLMIYDLKERKESLLLNDVDGYSMATDFSKVVFRSGKVLKVCEPKIASKVTDLKTDNLFVDRVPAEEWAEMFEETWRKFRDYFYVKNMHGYDWDALKRQYHELLPYVAHRSDLNYVLSEMVAELNVGHAYIQGGDFVQPKRPVVGLPGCRFELDTKSNRYKISTVFRGENEESKYRSPLTEVGVNAQVGDYVLQIDGMELTGDENPYRLLQHRSDPVTLTLNTEPSLKGSRKTVYVPVTSEQNLLYLDFVLKNREKVAKATEGRVGYLHIPDMGAAGSYEFLKWYYPQIRKEGLVIDVRSNGGGNISQWIIMRLNQQLLGTRFGGTNISPSAYPGNARFGHQVCLINETSASDGDIFPYYFRKAGLGLLIGKRSWGGVVGISPRGQLLDGGMVFVPLRGTNDENGHWIIEGKGVEPDIEVENAPKSMLEGDDPQLQRGIEEVLKRMEAEPKKWPSQPADPVKTKE
ncbi:MAG: PDZ domain-containing protein [Planctomycetaceae bacterium]|jgi:tricorn protease|nr:PDZ domain-containing protein [Planctomycetaceae bacterium]